MIGKQTLQRTHTALIYILKILRTWQNFRFDRYLYYYVVSTYTLALGMHVSNWFLFSTGFIFDIEDGVPEEKLVLLQ